MNFDINFNLIDNLTFKQPILYDKTRNIIEISAYNGDNEVGYAHYKRVKKSDKKWYSDLTAVKEKYRIDYNGVALILRLLVHAKTGFSTVKSRDYSRSGQKFMEKWDSVGYWMFDLKKKTSILTEFGKKEAEKFAEKYLNIKNINWL